MATIEIELIAPDHEPVSLTGTRILIPGAAGIFTVLSEHTPTLTKLTHGIVVVEDPEGKKQFFSVHEGFAEVAGDRVVILADCMERGEDIATPRAQSSLDRARKRLQKPDADTDIPRAEASMARALARLRARSEEEY